MDKVAKYNLSVIHPHATEGHRTELPRTLTVEVIRDRWRLEGVRNEWTHLAEKAGAHIFQSFDWLTLWWKHFGGFKVLHVLLFRHHGVLVGAAPFFVDHKTLLGIDIYARLRLLGSLENPEGLSSQRSCCPESYVDILSLPAYEEDVVHTLLKYLHDHYDLYDEIYLDHVPEESLIVRKVLPALESVLWQFRRSSTAPVLLSQLPESFEGFMQSLQPEERHQFHQARRSLTHWRLFAVESQRELIKTCSVLARLHRSQSEKRGKISAFANPVYDAFIKDFLSACLQKHVLSLRLACRDDKIVAVHCGVFFNGRAYDYLKANDEHTPTSRRKPGRALFLSFIEQAIGKGLRSFQTFRANEADAGPIPLSQRGAWNIIIPNPPRYSELRFRLFHAQTAMVLFVRRSFDAVVGVALRLREYMRSLRGLLAHSENKESETDEGTIMMTHREAAGKPEFRLEIIQKEDDFLRVQLDWERTVELSNASIYQTFDWMWQWWRHFAQSNRLHIVLIRRGEELAGIMPLFVEVRSVMGVPLYRRLKFLGSGVELGTNGGMLAASGPSDYLDMIAVPAYESDCAREFAQYLQQNNTGWSAIEFVNLPEQGAVMKSLLPACQELGMKVKVVQTDVCPRIPVPQSLELYMKGLNSNTRHRLHQSRKTFLNDDRYSVETVDSPEKLKMAFSDLMKLHQQRWNRLGYSGLFSDSRFARFQEDIVKVFLKKDRLWFKSIMSNGTRIACRVGFVFKNRFYDYLTGFDDTAPDSKRRPGMALLLSMIEDASRWEGASVDLLRGSEPYKFELTSDIHHNYSVTITNQAKQHRISLTAFHLAQGFDAVKGRVLAEWSLLRVQYREHGVPLFVAHYIVFRLKRAAQKLNDWAKAIRRRMGGRKFVLSAIPVLARIQRLRSLSLVQKILRGLKRDKNLPLSRRFYKGLIFLRGMILARIYLRKCDSVGKRARTRARPLIDNLGRIEIGDDFNINSRIVRCELATGGGGLIRIGNEVGVNFGTCIFAQKHVDIGDRVHIGPYGMILDTDFHTAAERYSAPKGDPIIVEDDVWIGGRVSVLKGTRIGKGSVVMAGSVVSGVIPPHVIAGGVPARVIRSLNPENNHTPKKERDTAQRTNQMIAERVASVFRRTFQIQGHINQSWGPSKIAGWDSLGHLNMISEVEQEFGISLTEDDMMRLRNVREVCAVVEEHVEAGSEEAYATRP